MDFAFTDEQQMIRDSAAGFLAELSDSAAVRRAMATEQGYESEVWAKISGEMYWQALHLPEALDGLGLGFVELSAIMEQMGGQLLCAPFFATVCQAANVLLLAEQSEARDNALAAIVGGETAALAWQSKNAAIETAGSEVRLSGEFNYVIDGHSAATIVVAARAENGVSLIAALPADSEGLRREWLPTMDQTRKQATLTFDNVVIAEHQIISRDGAAAVQGGLALASIALAAEQVGGAQKVLDMAMEYTMERVQFGRQIASYQAIKHKAADMMLRVEVARSAAYYAACVADKYLAGNAEITELQEAASVAKVYCSEAYFKNAGECIQLHGGVGFTWEYDPHLHFKRAKASELMLGTPSEHRETIAAMLLDGEG